MDLPLTLRAEIEYNHKDKQDILRGVIFNVRQITGPRGTL